MKAAIREQLKKLLLRLLDALGPEKGSGHPENTPDSPESVERPTNPPEAERVRVDWCYGGFDGSKAAEDQRCRIADVRCTKDRITYKWHSGIPSDWKRKSTEKGDMVVACAFVWDGYKWKGGKMDWTDERRSSRSTENIHDRYCGWNPSEWDNAKRRAFCVASSDGKRRSNLEEG